MLRKRQGPGCYESKLCHISGVAQKDSTMAEMSGMPPAGNVTARDDKSGAKHALPHVTISPKHDDSVQMLAAEWHGTKSIKVSSSAFSRVDHTKQRPLSAALGLHIVSHQHADRMLPRR